MWVRRYVAGVGWLSLNHVCDIIVQSSCDHGSSKKLFCMRFLLSKAVNEMIYMYLMILKCMRLMKIHRCKSVLSGLSQDGCKQKTVKYRSQFLKGKSRNK